MRPDNESALKVACPIGAAEAYRIGWTDWLAQRARAFAAAVERLDLVHVVATEARDCPIATQCGRTARHVAGRTPLGECCCSRIEVPQQQRITGELDAARRQLADVSVEFDAIEQNLNKAVKLAKDCHAADNKADDNARRPFNQAFFERLHVHVDGAVTHDNLAEPFGLLLDPSLPDQLSQARSAGKPARSNRSTDRPGRSRNGNDLGKTEVEGLNVDTVVPPTEFEWCPRSTAWCTTSRASRPAPSTGSS